MANLTSSKKGALTSESRRQQNIARRSEVKSVAKSVLEALARNDVAAAKELLKVAESKIARARGKGVFKKNTAARKIGGLARRVAVAERAQ